MTGNDASKGSTGLIGGFKRLYHGETKADIVGRWKTWFSISLVLILIGIAALATRGLNLGIDFTGGTIWRAEAGEATVAQVTDAVTDLGYGDVQVQEVTETIGGREVRQIHVEADASVEASAETTAALDRVRSKLGEIREDLDPDVRAELDSALGRLAALEGPFSEAVPEPLAAIEDQLEGLGDELGGDDATTVVRTEAELLLDHADRLAVDEEDTRREAGRDVLEALAELTGTPVEDITVDQVGPSWGRQISEKARTALIVFMLAITLFITIRFEFKMAMATVVALFHDLILVVGLYAIFGFPVTPSTVVALLTMLGFSMYDGIVVFDRVDDNTGQLSEKTEITYSQMANLSLNQVLMRSINTSITTLLPILSVLVIGAFILGATTLEEFGLALFLGLLAGAYSSLFIATPLLALLKEREPRYRDLREQIESRGWGKVREEASPSKDPVRDSVLGASSGSGSKAGSKPPRGPKGEEV